MIVIAWIVLVVGGGIMTLGVIGTLLKNPVQLLAFMIDVIIFYSIYQSYMYIFS